MKCDNGHDMTALIPQSRPASSEWYCEKCHKSLPMTPDQVYSMSGGKVSFSQADVDGDSK